MSDTPKLKIFVSYHKDAPIYQSEVFSPIQTGACTATSKLNMLADNSGLNISSKNKNYAELTAWFWILKNYLSEHPELTHVGVCHYRRFLDISSAKNSRHFVPVSYSKFNTEIFPKIADMKAWEKIQGYDIVLPNKEKISALYPGAPTVYHQFLANHPKIDLLKLIDIVKEKYPTYSDAVDTVLSADRAYWCLTMVIRPALFIDLATWIFDILSILETQSSWESYTTPYNLRCPGFLAERFVNVWYEKNKDKLKILETDSYLLQ